MSPQPKSSMAPSIGVCLSALLALTVAPACNINRVVRVDQVALMPVPTGARIQGPQEARGQWSVQGDFAGGLVPSAARPRGVSARASHEATSTLLRGAASVGLASRLELSLWGDLGHRALASDTVQGIHKGELSESTSAWGGFALRNRFPIGQHAIRLSSEFGVGRVPWARMVRVTDWVRDRNARLQQPEQRMPLTQAQLAEVEAPGEHWTRFQDAFIRRGVAIAVRTALFGQAELQVRPDVHLNLGLGMQIVPYSPGSQVVLLACGDFDSPDVRNRACGIDGEADILRSAMLGTLTLGMDWPMGDVAWFADAWWHFTDNETGAASAPLGLALGVRY